MILSEGIPALEAAAVCRTCLAEKSDLYTSIRCSAMYYRFKNAGRRIV